MSNVFSFTGACGNDAEVRYSPSGLAILHVNVANNIGYGDKRQTLWVRVTLFGKQAEGSLKEYLKKGTQVFVSGELSLNEYRANDGTMKTSLQMVANVLDLIGKKNDASQTGQESYSALASRAPNYAPAQPSGNRDNFDNDAPYDDDIPF